MDSSHFSDTTRVRHRESTSGSIRDTSTVPSMPERRPLQPPTPSPGHQQVGIHHAPAVQHRHPQVDKFSIAATTHRTSMNTMGARSGATDGTQSECRAAGVWTLGTPIVGNRPNLSMREDSRQIRHQPVEWASTCLRSPALPSIILVTQQQKKRRRDVPPDG